LEKRVENFNNSIHAGMSSLEWDEAAAPSVFGISAKAFMAFSSLKKEPLIGMKKDGFTLSAYGLQAGFGTAGVEGYVRFLPEVNTSGADVGVLGFGLKYDISDLIPAPALPAISVYASYNTQSLGATQNRNYTVQGITEKVKTAVKFDFSTINFGVITGYDLILLSIYAKAGFELGSTDVSWEIPAPNSTNTGLVSDKSTRTIDSSNIRYAAGVSIFGIKLEIGGRGSNISAGAGYGISF
jgi:hypothetical protein